VIAAVVLAAGRSQRMGTPKINLPWPPPADGISPPEAGCRTVLGQVVDTLVEAGLDEILIVTGPVPPLEQPHWSSLPVRLIQNPRFAEGEMLSSLQIGLEALPVSTESALVVLGDQPQIQIQVVHTLLQAFEDAPQAIIVPSYRMRRGHPWLLPRRYWAEVLRLVSPLTLRDFLHAHAGDIVHLPVDTPTILQDLDTPADYHRKNE